MWKLGLLAIFISNQASAYNLTKDFLQGFYWASLPIAIHIEEADASLKSTLESLTADAMGEWESRTGLSLWDNATGNSNIIRWSKNFATETKMDPVSVLAVAIRYTNGPYFARTEIVINGNHPLNYDLTNLLTTITHELGHTMGLDHSENMSALMAPTLQDPYKGLHNDDIAGMKEAVSQTKDREASGYISPLAFEEKTSKQALHCGTVGAAQGSSMSGMISLSVGMLIGFVRKIFRWFKSLF